MSKEGCFAHKKPSSRFLDLTLEFFTFISFANRGYPPYFRRSELTREGFSLAKLDLYNVHASMLRYGPAFALIVLVGGVVCDMVPQNQQTHEIWAEILSALLS